MVFLPSSPLFHSFSLYLRFRYFRFSVFFQPPRIFSSSFLYLNVRLDNLSCKTPACLPYPFGASGGFCHTTLDCFSVERAKFGLEKDLLFSHLPLTSTRTYIHHTTLTLEEPNISLSIALEALR